MNKTHYRKVHKSDHLGVADLEDLIEEGKRLVFTISEVKQEIGIKVAGVKGNHNIAYFKEKIKPLVLNVHNSKILKSFNNNSSFIEDWAGTTIELYVDENVKMKGETVGGVRIKPVQPVIYKPVFGEANFEKAKKAGATIEQIEEIYSIDEITKSDYLKYIENGGTTD